VKLGRCRAAIVTIVTTLLVYAIPNRTKP